LSSLRIFLSCLLASLTLSGCDRSSDKERDLRVESEHSELGRVQVSIEVQECVNRCLTRNTENERCNWDFARLAAESCLADRGPLESIESVWATCAGLLRETYLNSAKISECRSWCEPRYWSGLGSAHDRRSLTPCERCESYRLHLAESVINCRVRCRTLKVQVIRACDRAAIHDMELCRKAPTVIGGQAWQACLEQRDSDYSECMSGRFARSDGYCDRACPASSLDCSRFCGDVR
jgi:hypothetical protein